MGHAGSAEQLRNQVLWDVFFLSSCALLIHRALALCFKCKKLIFTPDRARQLLALRGTCSSGALGCYHHRWSLVSCILHLIPYYLCFSLPGWCARALCNCNCFPPFLGQSLQPESPWRECWVYSNRVETAKNGDFFPLSGSIFRTITMKMNLESVRLLPPPQWEGCSPDFRCFALAVFSRG